MISGSDLVDGFEELLRLLDDQDAHIRKAKYSKEDRDQLLANNEEKRRLIHAMTKRFL